MENAHFFCLRKIIQLEQWLFETEASKAGACLHHDLLHNRNHGSGKHGVDLQAEAQSFQR